MDLTHYSLAPSSQSSRSHPLQPLGFPPDHHLLITTRQTVSSLSTLGIRKLFVSSTGSIVAAKELGAEVLAIADGKVVRFCRKGETTKRYRLRGGDGQLAVLKPIKDGSELLFTSSLHNGVMSYSLADDRTSDLALVHPSTPTAVAVSAKSVYTVSASHYPPVIYVRLLNSRSKPVQIIPHASQAPVTAISFHPEREEIFLLGYTDGTVSIHTASRILLMKDSASDGAIAHMKRLHRTTNSRLRRHPIRPGVSVRRAQQSTSDLSNVGATSMSVTAASFMGGYRARVISVGGDGKCRMIDFARGASLLRTWNVSAPCTSLAIYSPPDVSPRSRADLGDPTLTDPAVNLPSGHIIAVGREDGYVSLFDNLGLLREDQLISTTRKAVVGLDWVLDGTAPADEVNATETHNMESSVERFQRQFAGAQPESGVLVKASSSKYKRTPESNKGKIKMMFSPGETSTGDLPSTPQKQMIPSNLATLGTPPHNTSSGNADCKIPRLLDSLRRTPFTPSPPSAKATHGDASSPFSFVQTPPNQKQSTPEVKTAFKHLERLPTKGIPKGSHESPCEPRSDMVVREFTQTLGTIDSWKPQNSLDIENDPSESSRTGTGSLSRSNAKHRKQDRAASGTNSSTQVLVKMDSNEETPQVKQIPRFSQLTNITLAQSDGWETENSSPEQSSPYHLSTENGIPSPKDRHLKLRRMTRHDNVDLPKSKGPPQTSTRSSLESNPLFKARLPCFIGPMISRSTASPVRQTDHSSYRLPSNLSPSRIPVRLGNSPQISPSRVPLPLSPAYYKHLPSLPVSEPASCNCDCADVVRAELALVRAEISSLRKSIWVFGSRVERERMDAIDGRKVFDMMGRSMARRASPS